MNRKNGLNKAFFKSFLNTYFNYLCSKKYRSDISSCIAKEEKDPLHICVNDKNLKTRVCYASTDSVNPNQSGSEFLK